MEPITETDATRENRSLELPNESDTKRPVKSQKKARNFCFKKPIECACYDATTLGTVLAVQILHSGSASLFTHRQNIRFFLTRLL